MKFIEVDDTHWVNIGNGNVAWLQTTGQRGEATLIVWQTGKFIRVAKPHAQVIRLLEEGGSGQ